MSRLEELNGVDSTLFSEAYLEEVAKLISRLIAEGIIISFKEGIIRLVNGTCVNIEVPDPLLWEGYFALTKGTGLRFNPELILVKLENQLRSIPKVEELVVISYFATIADSAKILMRIGNERSFDVKERLIHHAARENVTLEQYAIKRIRLQMINSTTYYRFFFEDFIADTSLSLL